MRSKKILFSAMGALLPLLVLALVEFSLWVFDAYSQPPLFLEVEEDELISMQINSNVGERYFDKLKMPVPNLYPQEFSAQKTASTLRIFCLGGSTTAGYPYEMTVPFPKQLELMLKRDYPGRKIEVINLGISAINSYTVLDLLPEVMKQDPDMILIYMGHNEFYGAYGTGSTISLGHNAQVVRLVMKLQKLRVVQMAYALMRGEAGSSQTQANSTLMEKVIEDKFIENTSVLRMKTRANFASNVERIIKICQAADVPLILSNVVSNIKDQPPLDMTSGQLKRPTKAEGLYRMGFRQFQQGDTITANISLTRARNTDQVPFRGNDYINEILRAKAQKYKVTLVDMEQAFKLASPATIPGNELFSDHLHPNPIGYHLMARQFYPAVIQHASLPVIKDSIDSQIPLLVTELDWEIGALKIFKLLHRWPFQNKPVDYSDYTPLIDTTTVKIAQDYLFNHQVWGKAHDQMAKALFSQKRYDQACIEYQAILEVYPEKIEFYTKLVDCAKLAKRYDLVEETCVRALKFAPETGMFHYNLAIARRVSGEMESAMKHIKAAAEAPELTPIQRANVRYSYARFLIDLRRPSEAAALLAQVIKEVPDFKPAEDLLNKLIN